MHFKRNFSSRLIIEPRLIEAALDPVQRQGRLFAAFAADFDIEDLQIGATTDLIFSPWLKNFTSGDGFHMGVIYAQLGISEPLMERPVHGLELNGMTLREASMTASTGEEDTLNVSANANAARSRCSRQTGVMMTCNKLLVS